MDHIEKKYADVSRGFLERVNFTYKQRCHHLKQLRYLIVENEVAILKALKEDLGKGEFEGVIGETLFVVKEIDHTLKRLKKWMKKKRVGSPILQFPARSYIVSEPLGVVLVISPWNYPFQLLISPLVGALAAGNTAILKPSEVSVSTSKIIAELVPKYFKSDVVGVVEGAVPETQTLLDLPFHHIFYTGNSHVGRIVMEKAAKHLCPVTLELGGKSPCFIDKNNDLELVGKRLAWGKFFNTGQTCVAPDYVLVESSIREGLVKSIEKALKEFFPQGPKNSPDYGRIINERHFERIESYIVENELLLGGQVDKNELFIEPTVLLSNSSSPSMKDEIFGPVLPIIEVGSFSEAKAFIRERPHPLAAYAFSKDNSLLEDFSENVTAGGMCLNDSLVHLNGENLPFGGVGESGMGSYHGKRSFDIFSHHKSIMKRGWFPDLPVRYPPYDGKIGLVRRLLSWFS